MIVSNKSTIHRRMKCFVQFIAPDPNKREDIKRQADDIRSCIERNAKEEGYIITGSPSSGSFAKKTGLRRHLQGNDEVVGQDIDIAFILEDKDSEGNPLGCMVHHFERYLRECNPKCDVGSSKSAANISFSKTKLQFDAVPLIKTKRKDIQKLIRTNGEERQSSVQKQNEFVKSRNKSSNAIDGVVKFNECMRLMKWWRYQRQTESGVFGNGETEDKVPSFLLDLLGAKAYETVSVSATYPETLARWFSYLAHIVRKREDVVFKDFIKEHEDLDQANWRTIDPMDDTNNVVKNWPEYKINELADWFEAARDKMAQAIRHDREGDDQGSLNCLVELFGNSIKTQCKDLS